MYILKGRLRRIIVFEFNFYILQKKLFTIFILFPYNDFGKSNHQNGDSENKTRGYCFKQIYFYDPMLRGNS